MENRKKLHDYGLILIVFSFVSLVTFATGTISLFVKDDFITKLEAADSAVRIVTIVLLCISGALSLCKLFGECFVGYKGLQISKNPTAARGHITLAKVFFVLSIILAATLLVTLISDKNADVLDTVFSLACAVCDIIIYKAYINAANAVRQDAIKG